MFQHLGKMSLLSAVVLLISTEVLLAWAKVLLAEAEVLLAPAEVLDFFDLAVELKANTY